jgi:hypothetical protein
LGRLYPWSVSGAGLLYHGSDLAGTKGTSFGGFGDSAKALRAFAVCGLLGCFAAIRESLQLIDWLHYHEEYDEGYDKKG